jgi:hypothetical protein
MYWLTETTIEAHQLQKYRHFVCKKILGLRYLRVVEYNNNNNTMAMPAQTQTLFFFNLKLTNPKGLDGTELSSNIVPNKEKEKHCNREIQHEAEG